MRNKQWKTKKTADMNKEKQRKKIKQRISKNTLTNEEQTKNEG
jgi:hypothetical protein